MFYPPGKKLRKTFFLGGGGGGIHPPSLVRPGVNIYVARYHNPEIIYRHENINESPPGGGPLLGNLRGSVPLVSPNPDPILDPEMSFSTPVLGPCFQNPDRFQT